MSEHSQKTPFIKASSQDQYGKIPLKSWVGKVVAYEAQKDQIEEGWGWRYKVRILGDDSNSQNVADEELDSKIQELKSKIEIEGFESVARGLSISESALKGGDLGWINENVISDDIKFELIKTPKGTLSSPVMLGNGILIFKVRDKRKIKQKISLEEIKNELINAEKSKILNMHSMSHYDKVRRSVSIKFFK